MGGLGRGGLCGGDGGGGAEEAAIALRGFRAGREQGKECLLTHERGQRVVCAGERGGGVGFAVRDGQADGMSGGEQLEYQRGVGQDLVLGQEERALQAVFFQRGHAVTHGLAVGKGEEDGSGLFLGGRVGLRARIAAGTLGRLALCLAAAGILLHAVGDQVFRLFDEQ